MTPEINLTIKPGKGEKINRDQVWNMSKGINPWALAHALREAQKEAQKTPLKKTVFSGTIKNS